MMTVDLPALPALVSGTVAHQRRGPIDHGLKHEVYQWLVDLDDLPEFGGPLSSVSRFSAEDHLGDPSKSIKSNVIEFARLNGLNLPRDVQIVMLANARVLGYVFDPLSVHWCLDRASGATLGVIAEVHNTYGERHAYLLQPNEHGSAVTHKQFFVSPFYDVTGRYRLTFRLSPDRVAVAVTLHRGGVVQEKPDFTATFTGRPRRATRGSVLRTTVRYPLMSQRVSALIKAHGIYLWAKKLPLIERPHHEPPKGVEMTQSDIAATSSASDQPVMPLAPATPIRGAIAKRLYISAADKVRARVLWPDGSITGGGGPETPVMQLLNPDQFFARIARDLKIGFGEAYMAGDWREAPGHDLADLLEPWAAKLGELVPSALQPLRALTDLSAPQNSRNTREGSKNNIEAHYDLSNELFTRFLDPSMTYSSALFDTDEPPFNGDFEAAQQRKIDSILDMAGVREGSRVLEIGSGWGSALMRAAQRGANVTSVTLSQEQRALAQERVDAAGLSDRVDLRIQDYRDVTGEFDAIISIEMIEAVGEEFWPTYFAAIDSLLAPGGRAAIQSIIIGHDDLVATRKSQSWITKYVFPGGTLPSIRGINDVLREHTALHISRDLSFGRHYAATLLRWRQSFLANWDDIAQHGFDERFRRMWVFYLAYCEAGFRARHINVHQLQLVRD
ncbi:DUF1365 family protein [Ornithinimicrobium sp. Arc0846-15]|nr:DUF1365 family protein [Ornithinimicrobium laminariae]